MRPHSFLSLFGERELSTPFPFLLQKRKRCRAAKGKEGVGKPSVWFPHTPSIGQSLALDLRRMEVKKSTIEFVGADAERSCSRRRSVTDAACPLRVLIGPSPPHGNLLEDPRGCHGSRARKERAPGIPHGMMRGKCAHWLAMTRLFGDCTRGAGQSPQYVV